MCTAGIFMDLSKAFDTIDHDILLQKTISLWFQRGIQWVFTSYLSNRKQMVSYDSTLSSSESVKCVVPQESILGQLLFYSISR